jgi:hypothetical protein
VWSRKDERYSGVPYSLKGPTKTPFQPKSLVIISRGLISVRIGIFPE